MTAFLDMGGDAFYVWTAFGITLAVIVLNVWFAHRKLKRALEVTRRASPQAESVNRPKVRQLQ